ncbi:MAG TPA: flavin reductase family protein [Thermoplasmata archaeon]|nr:flavin reductase family protein [Thermoplasmata archaeon]
MTAPDAPVDPAAFRSAMGRWATGVSVVTAHAGGVDAGLTVNALLSVALAPPTLLVSLQRDVEALPVLRASGRFAVSLLAADQRELSVRFAAAVPSVEKFRGLAFHRGATGAPLLDGALAVFECRRLSETAAFDHVLVVGEVVRLEAGPDRAPLLFYRGAYADEEAPGRLALGRRGP